MRTRWFDQPLETIAMVWRLERRDGIVLGFATHDRDLLVDQFTYRAAPGMMPSAIEADDGLDALDLDIGGVLTHDLIRSDVLATGRWDAAAVRIGLVDWLLPNQGIGWFWSGTLGAVSRNGMRFSAELQGVKARLDEGFAPVTSPSCRAAFCDRECGLNRSAFERCAEVASVSASGVTFAAIDPTMASALAGGRLRWVSGDNAGLEAFIEAADGAALQLVSNAAAIPQPGDRAILIEGCDKTLATCATRFGNAVNFRGEPHLPGNDLLTRFAAL
ncbi:DUF2163 domain-containing protein [Blastomonas sp.]|uniref:DUF2163 domain-containing protein n=1 Tax=Blastomonas sp. TaxID=1909299 RepID=UPI003594658A